MVSLHLRELSLTSNVHSLLPSPPKIQEVESWLKYWASALIIVAHSPDLKFSQTGRERSLVNKNVEKIKIKNISKQETKRIKHFKSSKIHLSPFQIMTTSFRFAKTMHFLLHPSYELIHLLSTCHQVHGLEQITLSLKFTIISMPSHESYQGNTTQSGPRALTLQGTGKNRNLSNELEYHSLAQPPERKAKELKANVRISCTQEYS